jgi:pyridoxal phosphate enzyme (YggS family)
MTDVAANLQRVQAEIALACARVDRDPGTVRLIAVSKLQPAALIRAAFEAGQRDFGENYAQELRDKATGLADLPGLRWHAIGPLQSNKVKYVTRVAAAFHALDRLDLGRELGARRLEDPIEVFIEVNIAGETSKHGVAPSEVPALVAAARALPGLRLTGLMTMPPQGADDWEPEHSRPWFRALRELARAVGLAELSMGTTDDFPIAIEEGATVVRVGRSIFGERVG